MSDVTSIRARGWAYVAIQAVLLVALIVLPGRSDWPTPPTVRLLGLILIVGGLAFVALASLRLGPALTATPVPTESGALTTTGLYRLVRHPIYTGVLAIVVGLTLRSGSWVTLAVGIVTVGFFHSKARWEEARLADRYPDYPAYAAVTPRFVPWPRPSESRYDGRR